MADRMLRQSRRRWQTCVDALIDMVPRHLSINSPLLGRWNRQAKALLLHIRSMRDVSVARSCDRWRIACCGNRGAGGKHVSMRLLTWFLGI